MWTLGCRTFACYALHGLEVGHVRGQLAGMATSRVLLNMCLCSLKLVQSEFGGL